ncbi:type III PLP-dependent enzyme [Pacificoceanicola onchidii]|uniref:type III PLP-dependent enzyme n=1 Tax=Pacificoceanicola onchidii TaxID=2562685 RepID=UPI0010A3CB33|nr:type III PLP-dependent enzyme [Pacificoceanicola onchidii]
MGIHPDFPFDLAEVLAGTEPDRPVYLFSPAALIRTFRQFETAFSGEVTFAVKANPERHVLRTLCQAGMRAFDVASVDEMRAVRAVCPEARLHYHNPVRSAAEIAAAKRFGITSWSIDRISELDKLGEIMGQEIAVRIKLPVKGAAYDFGSKFGAEPELAQALLRAVEGRGARASITFHPGTQCDDPEPWRRYIAAAAEIAEAAGIKLERLNVGGGFAANRGVAPDLQAVFAAIETAVAASFGRGAPKLVCEPGRAMVSESFTLVLGVKALCEEGVFLSDGLYGALMEWRDLPAPERITALDPDGMPRSGPRAPRVVFGPTCDSLDRLPEPLPLPQDLAAGDRLVIRGMGAYSLCLATGFNGYGRAQVVVTG